MLAQVNRFDALAEPSGTRLSVHNLLALLG